MHLHPFPADLGDVLSRYDRVLIPEAGRVLTVRQLNRALLAPAYNLIVHSSPFSENAGEYYHWHVEIMPRVTNVAGFEWGTGFYINPTGPEEAARVLRETRI